MKITTLAKRIEKSNEKFNSMTKEQKKVQIAKDCIDRIMLEQLSAVEGSLVKFSTIDKFQKHDEKTSVKTVLNTVDAPKCEVCAKGGLFLSYVGRTNEFNVNDFSPLNPNHFGGSEHQKLLEIFSHRELAYIEYAFEDGQFLYYDSVNNCNIEFTVSERNAIREFYNLYPSNNDRLIAICQNIIKNKGTFTLTN